MRFRIGPWLYRVRIAREELRDERNNKASALCDREQEIIWISSALPPRHRLKRLLHELRHAWTAEMGTPADSESDADSAASFAVDMMRQLTLQGGEAALTRLTCEGLIDHSQDGIPIGGYCIECKCGSRIALGDVVQSAVVSSEGGDTVARASYCDHCSHWICWTESATALGTPSGRIVSGPTFRRSIGDLTRGALLLCG